MQVRPHYAVPRENMIFLKQFPVKKAFSVRGTMLNGSSVWESAIVHVFFSSTLNESSRVNYYGEPSQVSLHNSFPMMISPPPKKLHLSRFNPFSSLTGE